MEADMAVDMELRQKSERFMLPGTCEDSREAGEPLFPHAGAW